jgi:hypothetical protein
MMNGVLSPLNDLSEGGEVDSNDNKLSKKIKAFQTVALACATALGNNLPLFSEISNLSVQPEGKKKNKKVEISEEVVPFDVLCKSMAEALCGDHSDVNYHTLHRIGIRFLYEFNGLTIDCMKAVAFISLLDKVSLHISENKDEKALQNCLSLLSTLIINYIKIGDINNTPFPESIILALSNVIQRSSGAGLSGVCNQPMTISDLIAEGVKGISSDDVGGRILLTLLSSTNSTVVSLISHCLKAFYITNPTLILLKIVVSTSCSSDVKVDNLDLYTPNLGSKSMLYVSPYAKAGALMALSQFTAAINSIDDMNADQSHLLIVLLPVLIAACCDQDVVIRKAGLILAQSYKQLRPVIKLNQVVDKKDKLSVSVSVGDLNILGALLSNAEGIYIYIYIYYIYDLFLLLYYVYIYIYKYICVHKHTCIYKRMYTHTFSRIILISINSKSYLYFIMNIYSYCIFFYKNAYINKYIYTHIYVCIYMNICLYLYICIYI